MCSGPLARVWHWGPLLALCVIKCVTLVTIHNINLFILNAKINAAVFLLWAGLTLYNFLQAMWEGPGFVPKGWKPVVEDDCQYLQYCKICEGYKAPRSHHCRKCGRCVKKMDHHCPWINTCVGWANHKSFTLFIMFAVIGCIHASIILIYSMYKVVIVRSHRVRLSVWWLGFTLTSIGFALGICLAVGLLFILQMGSILRNSTCVEDWIMEKCKARRKIKNEEPLQFPYDLGWRQNLSQVAATGDGLTHWPLRPNSSQYDLTIEQLKQKSLKRAYTKTYIVVKEVTGNFIPIISYTRASFSIPCDWEDRIAVKPNDLISVTRSNKHWLYGEVLNDDTKRNRKGWIPRSSAHLLEKDE